MIDNVRIAVSVNSSNNRNIQFACFKHSNIFFAGINNEESTRQFFHIFDTAKIFSKFFHLKTKCFRSEGINKEIW